MKKNVLYTAPLAAALVCAAFCAMPAGAQAPAPSITTGPGGRPNWVDRPDAAYPEAFYLARVGGGQSRAASEAAAFAALTGYFGQSVKSRLDTVESYKEQARAGSIDVSQYQQLDNAVQVTSHIDRLIGAEIGAVWQDADRTFYALAFMDKAKCAALYAGLLDANVALIAKLTTLDAAERGSLEAVSRYRKAAGIAGANAVFATVLAMLGGPNRHAELKSEGDYTLEAQALARAIPVQVVVRNDSGGRIKAAFTAALAQAGFRPGAAGSRYRLEAGFNLAPADFAGSPILFSRFTVDAALKDTRDGSTLVTFAAAGREGHATRSEADQRALRDAEEQIKTDFPAELEKLMH